MIKNIFIFLLNFKNNKGGYIAFSQFVSKLAMLINSMFIVRLLTKEEFGSISLALAILAFFMPFISLGSYNGLLRFGSLAKTEKDKFELSFYNFKIGNLLNLIIICLFLVVCYFYSFKVNYLFPIALILILRFVSLSFFYQVRIDFQIRNNNYGYAITDMLFNLLTLLLSLLLSFLFGMYGYVIALSVSFFGFSIILRKYFIRKKAVLPVPKKEFWEFSLGNSIANFLHRAISSVDTFMIGFFLTSVSIAEYRIASILPFNLFFIAQMFIVADYPKFIQNHKNKEFFKKYMKNYFIIFTILGISLILGSFILGNYVIQFLFGSDYHANASFYLLMITSAFCMLILIPFGNITVALGLVRNNIFASIGALSIQIVLGFLFVPKYGILGVAIASSFGYLFSGLYNMFSVYKYFRKF